MPFIYLQNETIRGLKKLFAKSPIFLTTSYIPDNTRPYFVLCLSRRCCFFWRWRIFTTRTDLFLTARFCTLCPVLLMADFDIKQVIIEEKISSLVLYLPSFQNGGFYNYREILTLEALKEQKRDIKYLTVELPCRSWSHAGHVQLPEASFCNLILYPQETCQVYFPRVCNSVLFGSDFVFIQQ